MNYGDVALGVECALPDDGRQVRGRAMRLVTWLMAALRRWA